MKPMPNVTIYADGAVRGNPGEGGWAALLIFKDGLKERRLEVQGHCENVTNNHMELKAIIEGLRQLKRPCRVVLYTDSSCAIAWTRKVPPRENLYAIKLHQQLKHVLEEGKHHVTFVHVKGHDGNAGNERVDAIAYAVARGLPIPAAEE